MSDTDSFIEEVTEEVRRDRLYKFLRKYAWVGILEVVTIVGGTAYLEFKKAQARTEAEAVGTPKGNKSMAEFLTAKRASVKRPAPPPEDVASASSGESSAAVANVSGNQVTLNINSAAKKQRREEDDGIGDFGI